MAIFVTVIAIAAAALTLYLVYSSLKPKENTREQYAIRCLATISALVTLAITSISSRQGISDQIIALVAQVLDHPLPEAPPAPFSEKALIVVLVLIAVYIIYQSHQHWHGNISSDEIDRKRMKRPNSLVFQAIDEGVRIARKKPIRKTYEPEQRVDAVTVPGEPNLVWHDHARELFELSHASVTFLGYKGAGWHNESKCWVGQSRTDRSAIIVLCVPERPSVEQLIALKAFDKSIAQTGGSRLYAVYKDEHSQEETLDNVTLYSEACLLEKIVEFGDYFNEIIRRVEKSYFAGTELATTDVYTPSSVSSDAQGLNVISDNLGQYLARWSNLPPGRQIALLGEYGQGKSTGALMYVYSCIKSDLQSSAGRIPILIELRGKSPANLSPQELLAAWAQQFKLQAAALMKLLIAGKLILIFEGFDEMANVANLDDRISHFRALWRFAYPKSKLIFTGRRNLFFEEKEFQIAFKISPGQQTAACEIVHLCPFDEEKINSSLRWVDQKTRDEINQASTSSAQIRDIVSRPSLLFIVASLWEELSPLLQNQKITSAEVIDKFILHSYARQEAKEPDLNFMSLTTTERRYFHEGLAAYMALQGQTNQISGEDLRAVIERLYKTYPSDVHISDSVIIETNRPPLRKRVEGRDDAVDAITTDVRTHGILVNDVSKRGAFRFAHKSFFELLAAKVSALGLLDVEPLFYRAIRSALGASIETDRSPERLSFFSEILLTQLRMAGVPSKDVPMAAFDLLTGIDKLGPLRTPVQKFQILMLRFTNSKRLRLFVVTVSLIAASVAFFSTSAFATYFLSFLHAPEPLLNAVVRYVPRHITGYFSAFFAVLYLAFIIYGSYMTTSLGRNARLWAAVLIVGDHSMRTNDGTDAMYRILGREAARSLSENVIVHYSLHPSLFLRLPTDR